MGLLNGKKILVVDDEDDLRESICRVFQLAGANVLMAGNLTEAFESLNANPVDIVFSDIRMPGGSGVELAKKVKNDLFYKPKFFLCTGYADLDESDLKELNVISVFSKPFESNYVIKRIADLSNPN